MDSPPVDIDSWESYGFEVNEGDRDDFILDVIRPIVESIEEEGNLRGFHFIRAGEQGGGRGNVCLRISAKTDVETVIDAHTSAIYHQGDNPTIWVDRDSDQAGEWGSEWMAVERERLSRRSFEAIEAKRDGKDVDLWGLFRRQSHIFAHQLGFQFFPEFDDASRKPERRSDKSD